jgi:hypothetical protein
VRATEGSAIIRIADRLSGLVDSDHGAARPHDLAHKQRDVSAAAPYVKYPHAGFQTRLQEQLPREWLQQLHGDGRLVELLTGAGDLCGDRAVGHRDTLMRDYDAGLWRRLRLGYAPTGHVRQVRTACFGGLWYPMVDIDRDDVVRSILDIANPRSLSANGDDLIARIAVFACANHVADGDPRSPIILPNMTDQIQCRPTHRQSS